MKDSPAVSSKDRIRQVFHYLQALEDLRNPVVREFRSQAWFLRFRDIPEHDCIKLGFDLSGHENDEASGEDEGFVENFVLKCRRPSLEPSPQPEDVLDGWIEGPVDDPQVEPKRTPWKEVLNDKGEEVRIRFDSSVDREKAWDQFYERWQRWSESNASAAEGRRVFERLYRLFGRLSREGDRVELVVADGVLRWKHKDIGRIEHPVLLQRVHLEFDPEIPEFAIVEADREVEFYTPLLRLLPDIEGELLAELRREVEREFLHPLETSKTSRFFRRLVTNLSPRGEFLIEPDQDPPSEDPRISRDPVLLLRSQSGVFSQAVESVLKGLGKEESELSSSLRRIVGIEEGSEEDEEDSYEAIARIRSEEDAQDVLYSKPANREQLQIAKKLERHDSVIVQGPPGTGKSHTIANLIGHLLAQGKSVLVTSHTTKALRVLRDLVDPALRGLCVNVLERDTASRHELETSIQEIVNRWSTEDRRALEEKAERLYEKRATLIAKLQSLKREAFEARRAEYDEIVIGDRTWLPSTAAKELAEGRKKKDDWIPGPVERGHPLPLSRAELRRLYRTNQELPEDDEIGLSAELPPTNEILDPADFRKLVQRYQWARDQIGEVERGGFWDGEITADLGNEIAELRKAFAETVNLCEGPVPEWMLDAIQAGVQGGMASTAWEELVDLIDRVVELRSAARAQAFRWTLEGRLEEVEENDWETCQDILTHVGDGELSFWSTWFRSGWKRFLKSFSVDGSSPKSRAHFEALSSIIGERIVGAKLEERWRRQMEPLGAPSFENMEHSLDHYASDLRRCLAWHSEEWEPCVERLRKIGFDYDRLIQREPLPRGDYAVLKCQLSMASPEGPIQSSLQFRQAEVWRSAAKAVIESLQDTLSSETSWGMHSLTKDLRGAVEDLDADRYRRVFQRVEKLKDSREILEERRALLDRLRQVAPDWARAMEQREGIHGQSDLPGDPQRAWTWRQLKEELDRRARLDSEKLPRKIEKTAVEMRRVTSDLIEALAWEAQLRRTDLKRQQALVGWSDTMRKIGKGTGKRAPKLRRQAREKMKECRSAVPVWIMPLARAVESFDPGETKFDVAIIDEASQMDVMGLIVFFLARKVIVVGDHEQVSPLAVGQSVEDVDGLISEHLAGVPNRDLYDGKTSIYDLARQSFKGLTVLLEHFRCVPPIIEFSNRLCYSGKIRPLRDVSDVIYRPFLVEKRIERARSENKVNEKEAEFTAALVASTVEQPEYDMASIGVISLVGDQQAIQIETILRRRLEPSVLEEHRILCGNAAQFQGDERDVMFLSVVDSPKDGPLRLRERQLFRQRYNVAVSRARDQLWLIHSLDPSIDLKPGDLRRRLIEHVRSAETLDEEVATEVESPLEEEVWQFLTSRNYKVSPQFEVGAYRIDLVVQGQNARLAVECDGERYHTIDNLRDDMERQAVLERLGWRFVRIRGSQFYQDPDGAMRPVLEELDHLGIKPEQREPVESEEVESEGLKDRVIRRAYELILEWRGKRYGDETHDEPTIPTEVPETFSEGEGSEPKVTEEEAKYLGQVFVPACSPVIFTPDEWYHLKRYGCYMGALASGKLRPRTDSQRRFVAVFKGEREPEDEYERLWWRYKERVKWEADPSNRAAMGPLRTLSDSPVGSREDFEKLHSGDKDRVYFKRRRKK